ncbi:MAG: serine/threonine-protein kinase [Candidatus Sulfotelmatobacter sp.]
MENPEIKQFGRYEVVAELGRGAMGVVYKARDPQIDRFVAVKTVSMWGQEPDEEKEFRLRFVHEAHAAGRLHHPGIVAIFDAGENSETRDPYIVLEYVAGEALNRILAREKKLPPGRALQLAEEIAEALDYAHAQGVIHRDIKPGNILVTEAGHAKIADFGIAKLNLAHFTVPGHLLGTPAYMAPEQLSGEGVDGRSDLFSLGVILYAMVTGHSPFQGDSATTVSFKVANREPIAASALDLSLPRELDEVIARAMAKDREQRYQRGAEFAEDLQQLQPLFKADSTTASLRAATPGTRSGTRTGRTGVGASATHQAVEMAQGVNSLRAGIRKAPVRDLILGGVIVGALLFAGVESKLFVSSPRGGVNSPPANGSPVSPATPNSNSAQTKPATAMPGSVTDTDQPPAATQARKRRPTPPPRQSAKQVVVPSSTLEMAVQHQFRDATLYVWVDGKLVLTRPLHGAMQKKLVVFGGTHGVDSETLKVPAGKHELRVRALSADQTIDLSRTVSAEFVGGGEKSLQVTFDKRNTAMRLAWQ